MREKNFEEAIRLRGRYNTTQHKHTQHNLNKRVVVIMLAIIIVTLAALSVDSWSCFYLLV